MTPEPDVDVAPPLPAPPPLATATLDSLTTGAVRVGDGPGARELIVATGADRIRFLHGIVTGDVAGTPVGGGSRSALLTPKGQVVADLRIFVRADDVWIVVAPGTAASTAAALSRYAIMDDFSAAPRAGFASIGLYGPAAAARLAAAGVDPGALASRPLWSHVDADVAAGASAPADAALWLVRARALGSDGFWIAGDAAAVAAVDGRLAAAGVPALDPSLAEVARILAGEPRTGAEITPDYFPMEVGLDEAIDYSKGCYLGQEPIVRIRDRGHVNYRLMGLEIEGPHDPAPSDPVESDAKPRAGRVTSVARAPGAAGVALALLHVSVAVGSTVRVKHGDQVIAARVRAAIPSS
jgi:tRNA-modifying protein YgfZ